jgi:hypothetical protein
MDLGLKFLKVISLFAIYKGIAMIRICNVFATAFGIFNHLMKKYTIHVERIIHVSDIVM